MQSLQSKNNTPAVSNKPFFQRENVDLFFGSNRHFFRASPIQAKLTVNKPGDIYEKEADAMADKVVQRIAEPAGIQTTSFSAVGTVTPFVQKKCAHCDEEEKLQKKEKGDDRDLLKEKVQKKPAFESNPTPPDEEKTVQRKCAGCEEEEKLQKKEKEEDKDLLKEKLQKKPIFESNPEPPDDEKKVQRKCAACEKEEKLQKKLDSSFSPTAPPGIESSLNSSKGAGAPLPVIARQQMESFFDTDFSKVRLHHDNTSAQMSKGLNALAFTHGSDIYFNSGKYDVNSQQGKHLLAHELTHVVQQGAHKSDLQRQDKPVDHLVGLNEMLDRFDVPEEEVITALRQLTPTEVATVTTGFSYKSRMADAFNIGEMVRAVVILHPALQTKLEWIEAAASSVSDINYPDIGFLIASAPQPERDVLKTNRWRDFFVEVCDNSTIMTAVTDLHFDLKTQLEWIEDEASPSNIDYSKIQPFIVAATQPDRDVLKTNRWRDFFVGVCTNATIMTAVTDLHFDLKTQLEWIETEASPSNIEYSQLQPFIIAATQPDRDGLKTDKWRDFFVGVCDDDTIIDAVTDLNFDIKTKIAWVMEEGTPYKGFKRFISAASAPDKATVLADAALLRKLMDYFSTWNNFAKTVELLGRNSPASGALLADPTVQAALSTAWAACGASMTIPGVPAPPGVHEEGGYIYMDVISATISTSMAKPGARASLPLNDPDPPDESITIGGFHTHPNVGPGWGAPFASPPDISWSTRNGIPLLIRGAFPVVATTSDTSTGSARLHLAGSREFPGSSGGEAPQTSLDGTYDDI